MKNCFSFLSFKSLTQAYLAKTSITHNKYLTPQFLEENNLNSAELAAQILSLNLISILVLFKFFNH